MTFIQVQNKKLFDNPASVWNKGKIKSDFYDQILLNFFKFLFLLIEDFSGSLFYF